MSDTTEIKEVIEESIIKTLEDLGDKRSELSWSGGG